MHRRLVLVLLTLVALVGSACGGGSSELTVDTESIAEPGFLGAAIDLTRDEGFNMAMTLDLSVQLPGVPGTSKQDVELGTGQVDGSLSRFAMDLGGMLDAVGAGAMFDGDLGMETITDTGEGVTYIRAPMFSALGSQFPVPGTGALAELGDGWGRVDHGELGGTLPSALAGQLSAGALGFDAILDLVRDADDAHEVGTSQIRGGEVTGVSASVTFDDLLGMSGMDLDSLISQFGGSAAETDQVVETMSTVEMPTTVWLDDDTRIHRVEMTMDMSPILEELAGSEAGQLGDVDFSFAYVIDVFDFGDPDPITVPSDAVDITDSYADLLDQLTGG